MFMQKRTSRSLWTSPESPAEEAANKHSAKNLAPLCFDLGLTLTQLSLCLDWLTAQSKYDPEMPRKILAGDLSWDWLHPYQGVPHEPFRERRKQFVLNLQKAQSLMHVLGAETKAPQTKCTDEITQITHLFNQLYHLEEERFYENLTWCAQNDLAEAKKDFEVRRTHLQRSITKVARSSWAKLMEAIVKAPLDYGVLIELGKRLETLIADVREELELDTEHDSARPTKWISLAREALDQAARSCDQLKTLTVAEWVDSQSSVDHQILTLIERVRHTLRNVPLAENAGQDIRPNNRFEHGQQTAGNGPPTTATQQAAVNSVIPTHLGSSNSFPHKSECTEPLDPDGWEELRKNEIVLFGVEIHLQHQQKLVLIRLLFDERRWLTAGDLALVYADWADWPDNKESRQAISAVVTKMEDALAEQLNIAYQKGIGNARQRPVQRSLGNQRKAMYRIDLQSLETLINKKR
jgi:hypothetical protein